MRLKQLDFVRNLETTHNDSQSFEHYRLFYSSSGTTISSSTSIDQSYIDSNPGPYTIEGGSETNPVTISIVSDLVITSADTYFIINSDYIIIGSDGYVVYINDVPLYTGLVLNLNSSNIIINGITIKGTNSTLNPGAGWIAGESFAANSSNNLIEYCSNYLPISINSGGIVGRDSKVFTVGCTNYGELLNNPLLALDNTNYQTGSGGIYGRNCEGNCDGCINYGDINGVVSGGIIGRTIKNFNITNCTNYGNINNNFSGGIVGLFFTNSEFINSLTISDCDNYGIIKGKCCGGIMFGNNKDGSIVSIKNCFNNSAVTGQVSGGICSQLRNGIIDSCINYSSLKDYNISGIVVITLDTTVTKCKNVGLLTGDYSNSGIVYLGGNTTISECKNYGAILSQYSAGILLFSRDTNCKVIDCSNDGEVAGKDCGGILGRESLANSNGCTNSGSISGEGSGGICGPGCGQSAVMENCINNGEVCGNNAGGIFGAWCTGTAKNCINAGAISGVSTGGIFGEFSQGLSDNSINNGHLYGVNTRNI